MRPTVSLLVSTYKRPDQLSCLLFSLKCQSFRGFEAIVLDNGDAADFAVTRERVRELHDAEGRFYAYHTSAEHCYAAANLAIASGWTRGEWLCFPSDDGYHCPTFLERLLQAATGDVGLIFSNCLYNYDLSGGNPYFVMDVMPVRGWIDKTGFLVKREHFMGFPEDWERPVRPESDGLLIEELVRFGVRPAKVNDILLVHS